MLKILAILLILVNFFSYSILNMLKILVILLILVNFLSYSILKYVKDISPQWTRFELLPLNIINPADTKLCSNF